MRLLFHLLLKLESDQVVDVVRMLLMMLRGRVVACRERCVDELGVAVDHVELFPDDVGFSLVSEVGDEEVDGVSVLEDGREVVVSVEDGELVVAKLLAVQVREAVVGELRRGSLQEICGERIVFSDDLLHHLVVAARCDRVSSGIFWIDEPAVNDGEIEEVEDRESRSEFESSSESDVDVEAAFQRREHGQSVLHVLPYHLRGRVRFQEPRGDQIHGSLQRHGSVVCRQRDAVSQQQSVDYSEQGARSELVLTQDWDAPTEKRDRLDTKIRLVFVHHAY